MSLPALRAQLATLLPTPDKANGHLSTGLPALDAALADGGIPCGRLTEILGPQGGGKTTLVRHLVARALADQRWVAYIDARHTLAPADWAPLAPDRLWVVRPPPPHATWSADLLLRSGAFGLVILDDEAPLPQAVAVRLTRLARTSQAALIRLRDDADDGRGALGAVRLRVRRHPPSTRPTRGVVLRLADPGRPAPAPSAVLTVTVEKGGRPGDAVTIPSPAPRARRLRAMDADAADRRGVARRNRQGERVRP